MAFTSLAYHMDLDWLKEAYGRTRKDGAAGVDGVSGRDYAENLEVKLHSLLARAKNGDTYKAPPVRRSYIPKADGSQRPLGIPTFEDKVLQRAVVMVMEPLYEQDFLERVVTRYVVMVATEATIDQADDRSLSTP